MQQAVPPTITTCVFDAYGTLFDVAAIADHARDALGDRADDLMELWRRKQLEYTWLRSLMGRHADFWHVTGDSLDFAMAAMGLDDPLLRSRLMDGFFTPRLYPDVIETLTRLRTAGMRTAILSNGSPPMLTAATKHSGLDLLMDAVISVERVGIFKPHPRSTGSPSSNGTSPLPRSRSRPPTAGTPPARRPSDFTWYGSTASARDQTGCPRCRRSRFVACGSCRA